MIKYFQLSEIKKVSGQCPKYENCRTGRDLPPEFCAKYRCNTFYQVDTLAYFRDLIKKLEHHVAVNEEEKKTPDIARIVQQHFNQSSNSNGNGHSNGNGKTGRISSISASFSQ